MTLFGGSGFDDSPTVRLSDGKLAFHNDNEHDLLLENGDGSGRTAIPNTVSGDYRPSWSPDGQ